MGHLVQWGMGEELTDEERDIVEYSTHLYREYAELSEDYERHPKVTDTGGGLPGEIYPL